jgi:hypothetical protein
MNIETSQTVSLRYTPGADVLPLFNHDCSKILWTSTRDGRQPSQLYIADFVPPREE